MIMQEIRLNNYQHFYSVSYITILAQGKHILGSVPQMKDLFYFEKFSILEL